MRGAFANTLTELAAQDERIVLLTGDLGYMALEPFADRFPNRFYNVGVAEQNMVGIATGLAEAGFMPWVYSIVTFATLRPFEFIRNGPIQHQLPVRIVGVGGGLEYGQNGLSHYGLEDVGVLRTQPGLTIIAPSDSHQTRTALQETYDLPGPIYYRLGKDDKTIVPGLEGRFELGQCQTLGDGGDLLLLCMGNIAPEVVSAADMLSERGIECTIAIVSTINPAPIESLARLLDAFPLAMSIEAHYLTGGLGSLAAEVIAEQGLRCRLVRCGVATMPDGTSGSQAHLYRLYGLDAASLAKQAVEALDVLQQAGVGESR